MKISNIKNQILVPDSAYINGNWKHYNMDFHAHGVLEFNYILEGSCSYIVDGNIYELQKKNLLVIDSSKGHKKIFNHTVPCTVLGFSIDTAKTDFPAADLSYLLEQNNELLLLLESLNGAFIIPDAHSIKNDMEELTQEFAERKAPFYLYTLANKLLISIARLSQKKNGRISEYIHNIEEYVQCNYHQIENIADIASYIGLHQTYMERIFKKEKNQTLWDYVTDYRLQAAANLLAYSDVLVGEIDALVGMNSRQVFYLQFKKRFGMSPLEYRKTMK
jgi:AraC-like DNA-binding protein